MLVKRKIWSVLREDRSEDEFTFSFITMVISAHSIALLKNTGLPFSVFVHTDENENQKPTLSFTDYTDYPERNPVIYLQINIFLITSAFGFYVLKYLLDVIKKKTVVFLLSLLG